ncbi:PGAP1-like protein-domain-containing protein [Mycena maculata]|uniref:GPI inositol-deacylase n=1 Tax=Mycena maculata TaxID=230809 RepID=A0AAD7MVH8_9AGAR|nr:PGAP1-like protein-domain-containing protein [Mycena maculata]
MRLVIGFITLFSVLAVLFLYSATVDIVNDLSPQGCRMSYMYPSYVLQSKFDVAWTRLARRYSLWLYRETNEHGQTWEPTHANGVPVLFIPGNAGSSNQVRSIASSAVRQYYDAPHSIASEFQARPLKPLDFFAVDFNEDLSAFHGPTIEAQTEYSARAIAYVLSLYPLGTQIIVMGHSMGGIVAMSLLPSPNISAIITMSTPHTLPPARFDARVDRVYDRNQHTLAADPTPVLSLCGGATDLMIPSEACVLANSDAPFRRTVFSSALEGAWTGVGHREMVWCHQVRWRVARAALELGAAVSPAARGVVLDRWLRDGHALPPLAGAQLTAGLLANAETLPENMHLVLEKPHGERLYLLPVPAARPAKLVLFVSRGSIAPVSPRHPISLVVSVFACDGTGVDDLRCRNLSPAVLKLIPSPIPGKPFPIPKEGSDESEGIVLFEANIPSDVSSKWVGIGVENGRGEGWITGGFVVNKPFTSSGSTLQLLIGQASIPMPEPRGLRTSFELPRLLSNALVVYRIAPRRRISDKPCADPLLAPLLMHASHSSETHYFPLTVPPAHRILLHTHAAAPHIHSERASAGLRFIVYSSGSVGCKSDLMGLDLSIDWSATLGRWASRYFTVLPTWATGVVAVILFQAWGMSERTEVVPTVEQSLAIFTGKPLQRMLLCSIILSVVPLPEKFYLGNRGEPLFSALAPLLLLISSGFVCASWWLLQIFIWPLGRLGRLGFRRRREETSVHRSTVISMGLIFLLILLFVPWQVAFLGCWMIHLYNCAASQTLVLQLAAVPETVAIPLLWRRAEGGEAVEDEPRRPASPPPHIAGNHNHNMHLLLLMTWLLPLAAPVLVVWARTLAVAGLTTPFDGDHFFLSAAPFLILVDFASWTNGPIFEKQSFEGTVSVRWAFACLGAAAFLLGSRKAYFVFDVAKVAIGLVVLIRIGPRYWGRGSWSPARPS